MSGRNGEQSPKVVDILAGADKDTILIVAEDQGDLIAARVEVHVLAVAWVEGR